MAVAEVQTANTFQFDNTNLVPTLSACTAGNIVVLEMQTNDSATDPAPGWPSGFTQYIAGAGGDSGHIWYYAAWKQMSGGETSFTITSSGTAQRSAVATEWSGVDTTTPIDVVGTVNNFGFTGSGTKSFNAITTVTNAAVVVAIEILNGGSTWTQPSGYTNIVAGGGAGWHYLSYKSEATAGLVTPGDVTLSGNENALLHTYALRPTSSGSNITVTPDVINLTLTTFAPVIQLAVIPPTTALTLTTFAPVKGDGVVPATLALSTSTFAPQVNLTIIPPTTALTLTTFAPDIGGSITVTPDTLALTLTAFAPTVTASTPTPTTTTSPAVLGGGGAYHRQGWLARESWPREEPAEEPGPDLVAMQRQIVELRRYWQLKREALKGDIELIEQAVILLAGILND